MGFAILDSFMSLFALVLQWVLVLCSPAFILLALIIFSCCWFFCDYYFIKKYELPKIERHYKKPSFMKRIVIQFPERIVKDRFNKVPNEFNEFGLHMFCGEQGSGKTTSVVELLLRLKKMYPNCKIRTNMNYKYQDEELTDWKSLIKNENGIYGQIEVIDEIQTWFSSLESKNFSPEMLTEISQQRKQRKMLIGTSQLWNRIAKPIREQTTYVYMPMTILGCLTIVRVTKPRFWDDEKQVFKRYLKTYFYIHTDEIRDAFDTYLKVERYKEVGFTHDNVITKSYSK